MRDFLNGQGLVGQGFFITVEGGEGVGKTTFVKSFCAALSASLDPTGSAVVQTREPGGTPVANSIRAIFANPPPGEALIPETEAMLVMAARAQHVAHLIRPALERGAVVICDRYADSTMVYQGAVGGLDRVWLESSNCFATKGLVPDLTFLLDCPVEISSQRSEVRSRVGQAEDGAQRYDAGSKDQHEKIRAGFLDCARRAPSRFVVLDATKNPGDLTADALAALRHKAPEIFPGTLPGILKRGPT